jgi:hypothetical protein
LGCLRGGSGVTRPGPRMVGRVVPPPMFVVTAAAAAWVPSANRATSRKYVKKRFMVAPPNLSGSPAMRGIVSRLV